MVSLTSEAELHLPVRPAWKVGDPQQSHADGHGDRPEDVHVLPSAVYATLHEPAVMALGQRCLLSSAAASLDLDGSRVRDGAASSQSGQLMFEKANEVTKPVSVSCTKTKTHRWKDTLQQTQIIITPQCALVQKKKHSKVLLRGEISIVTLVLWPFWGWYLAQGHLSSALEMSHHHCLRDGWIILISAFPESASLLVNGH